MGDVIIWSCKIKYLAKPPSTKLIRSPSTELFYCFNWILYVTLWPCRLTFISHCLVMPRGWTTHMIS